MGRLGGGELGYGSDADVMFVCEPIGGVEESAAVRWAVTIAEQVRTLLGTPSADPPLEVDAEPASRGPQRLAGADTGVVRGVLRAVGADRGRSRRCCVPTGWPATPTSGERFLLMVDKTRYPAGRGVRRRRCRRSGGIKARVDAERLPRGADPNTHTKLGRGGLADIEWTVQLLQLRFAHKVPALHNTSTLESLNAIGAAELIAEGDVDLLRQAWLTATRARNALVLVRGKPTDQLPGPGPPTQRRGGGGGLGAAATAASSWTTTCG